MPARPSSLLATKLYLPPQPIGYVPRPHLVKRLQQGLEQGQQLTLISAPAGYGKTQLVVEWIRHENLPAAWVSLDTGDNDFVRFVRYLIAALQKLHPEIGDASLQLLQNAQLPSVEGLLTPLVNELTTLPASQPNLLVLDDYHLIQAQAVQDAVAFLVEYLPPQAQLVLVTRADPPLPLARWRGRGQLNEFRQADLRFTATETAVYMDMMLKLRLSPPELEMLTTRSEGWIAGLQMTTVSLHERENVAAFMQALTGSQRNILDYLLEEVLQNLPGDTQHFLISTSFLERLCGSLCDAVLDSPPESQAILENLERTNLFTIPLDDQRTWYRYHHLFADLLQTRLLQHTDATRLTTLRQRASQWYEAHGLLSDAIELALQAHDYPHAEVLIEQTADEMLGRGELVTFKRWLDLLPASSIRSHPELCMAQAWALLWSGSSFEVIAAYLQPLQDVELPSARLLPLQAYLALFQGEVPTAIQHASLALEQLPEKDTFHRSMAIMALAAAAQMTDDDDRGQNFHDQAIQVGLSSGNLLLSISMLSSLANLLYKEGQLGLAEQKYRQALELALDNQGHPLPVASRPLIGLASIALERSQLSGLEEQLHQAIQLSQSWGAIALVNAYMALARAQLCLGKYQAAQESLDKARHQARQFDLTDLDDLSVEIFQQRLNLQRNDLSAVKAWAERRSLTGVDPQQGLQAADFTNAHMRKYEYPILARLDLAQGLPAQALSFLDALLPHTRTARRPALVIETQLLRAQAFYALGRLPDALAALEDALRLAEPEGYIRLFLDDIRFLQPLLATLLYQMSDPGLVNFASHLISSFPATPEKSRNAFLLPEPLSPRELEVLHLLVDTSLSAEQIAERLYLSVHTVRSHIKSIYAKLGVHGRLEAASLTREMGLIASPSQITH